jgi:Fe-S-cluster containining protein
LASERPRVTQAEFDQIECNRCGACCEKLWSPGPLKLAEFLGARATVTDPGADWLLENDRFIAWLSALVPTGKVKHGYDADDTETHQYRCTRFVRLEDGAGFCTAYDDRPSACRGFPYDRPVHAPEFEACSYNVEIVGAGLRGRMRGLVRGIGKAIRATSNRQQATSNKE